MSLSGAQFEIAAGAQRAVVVEVGATLREYTLDGRPICDGFAVDERASGGRGQPLLPWPNRIEDGRYDFERESLQVPLDEVDKHNAIHGLTRWLNWSLLEHAADRVRLGQLLHPRPGYPFTLQLEIQYALDDAGLTVHTTARNVGRRGLPFGAGQHPYFTVGTPLVDEATLHLPAGFRVELDGTRQLPTGVLLPLAGTVYDFRTPKPIGNLVIDDCFGDLPRDANGRAHVTLSDAGTGARVTVWMDREYRYAQAFTGDTLAPPRRRRGVAIEPMTCPPNAFRTGVDLIVLPPGEAITLQWGVSAAL